MSKGRLTRTKFYRYRSICSVWERYGSIEASRYGERNFCRQQTADSSQPVAGLGRTGSELGSAKVTSSQGWHARLTVHAAFFYSGTIPGTSRVWCGS
ncbi:unnamed protein product [Gulo gulo]|uniref:Uncharacterized protein n=1 Tax=Gulo gulo TaxID=48420 RepID=A0A9X9LU82_GULGU|nr:unnamed protein product [Gulo gulo]